MLIVRSRLLSAAALLTSIRWRTSCFYPQSSSGTDIEAGTTQARVDDRPARSVRWLESLPAKLSFL